MIEFKIEKFDFAALVAELKTNPSKYREGISSEKGIREESPRYMLLIDDTFEYEVKESSITLVAFGTRHAYIFKKEGICQYIGELHTFLSHPYFPETLPSCLAGKTRKDYPKAYFGSAGYQGTLEGFYYWFGLNW